MIEYECIFCGLKDKECPVTYCPGCRQPSARRATLSPEPPKPAVSRAERVHQRIAILRINSAWCQVDFTRTREMLDELLTTIDLQTELLDAYREQARLLKDDECALMNADVIRKMNLAYGNIRRRSGCLPDYTAFLEYAVAYDLPCATFDAWAARKVWANVKKA